MAAEQHLVISHHQHERLVHDGSRFSRARWRGRVRKRRAGKGMPADKSSLLRLLLQRFAVVMAVINSFINVVMCCIISSSVVGRRNTAFFESVQFNRQKCNG